MQAAGPACHTEITAGMKVVPASLTVSTVREEEEEEFPLSGCPWHLSSCRRANSVQMQAVGRMGHTKSREAGSKITSQFFFHI